MKGLNTIVYFKEPLDKCLFRYSRSKMFWKKALEKIFEKLLVKHLQWIFFSKATKSANLLK